MIDETLKEVTDEQLESGISELAAKQGISEEEEKKLHDLKSEKSTRYQKRIDTLTFKAKSAEEKYEELVRQNEELKNKVDGLASQPSSEPVVSIKETIEVGSKKYYTDKTLWAMINSEELTKEQAEAHAYQRDKEKMKTDILTDISTEYQKTKEDEVRKADADWVTKNYPQFTKRLPDGSYNPDFNPNDPLFRTASELFQEAYHRDPQGFSKSIKRAKQILHITDTKPDVSDQMTMRTPSSPRTTAPQTTEVALDDDEKEVAIRSWRDQINPVTNRTYTTNEIIAKATKAKNARLKRRA